MNALKAGGLDGLNPPHFLGDEDDDDLLDDDEFLDDGLDYLDGHDELYYLPEESLKGMKEALASKKQDDEIKPFLEKILEPEKLTDNEILLPVDMRGLDKDFDSIDEIVKELGTRGAAEALLKCREHFEANPDKELEDERPQKLPAGEWRRIVEEFDEDDFLEDEEDFGLEDSEEEFGDDDPFDFPGDVPEPPPLKRPKMR
eukprot:TRINITY_DN78236_c0_g1_i1.p1 TRINITY_DN78236_c0_g1~~TRINITY_DN78236_c0_g1_i1.p1  ORF type:complete len:201 (+),score=72.97 TRINITY_DN78236_c0_g1_i1:53-655(+)